eukprot:TRINITY_DN7262_c0_g1_i1.p1 TRINITY_DN7262_c0_g1~~TRINITY_DN7262_c0_g1_i1.p1  ORF type:complete len:151 (-),score=28.73 TRINITY_DN7262_c0_g1_i1:53-505(-)
MSERAEKLGYDAELEKKRLEKYDPKQEADARAWIEEVTGKKIEGSFAEGLKSGALLCEVINKIKPGTIKKINTMKAPFMMMENIDSYIKACRALGVAQYELFMTVDLYEQQNMSAVLLNIFALSRAAQKGGFQGPHLAMKAVTSKADLLS